MNISLKIFVLVLFFCINFQLKSQVDTIFISKKTESIQKTLKIINFKKSVNKQFRKPKRNTKHFALKKFNKKIEINEFYVENFRVITLKTENSTNKHIFFLHGGAYIIEASSGHRKFIEKLILDYNFKVTYVDYPKAPENDFIITHKVVSAAYKEITRTNKWDKFYIFGDSAGGGLALALLQILRDSRFEPFPKGTILASPWLDLSLSNDKIRKYEEKDVVLPVEGLKYAAEKYSGGVDLKNPLLSPIYANLENLGKIQLFFGTNEIFYPDCLKLIELSQEAEGTKIIYTVGKGLMHDWIIIPSEETDLVLQTISDFVNIE